MVFNRQLSIGSQLFINRGDTPQQAREWIAAMAQHGLRLVRLFAFWDHLEPRPGSYQWETYDAVFDAAQQHDMQVVPTLFAVSPPGWMRLTGDAQALGPLEDPEYWSQALAHVRRVVEHWRGHPALHSWILWNEPSRVPPVSTAAWDRWVMFLRHKYADLPALNAHRYQQYSDWDQVLPLHAAGSDFRGYGEAVDRLEFAVAELQHWLCELRDAVRASDPHHPIHVNPHNVGASVQLAGQSIWREGEIVDFIGVSAHPPWHSTRFPASRVGHSVGYFADLGRSASGHGQDRFWVSELQGGPTWWSAEHPSCPSAASIEQWLWQAIGGGAEAVLFWCFNQRQQGFEGGEWGLLGIDGEPTDRLAAVARVAAAVRRDEGRYATARPFPAAVAILHSDASERLSFVEGDGDDPENLRNRHAHMDALAGAWLLTTDLGLSVQIVDEGRVLVHGIPASVGTLIVPHATALNATMMQHLAGFVRNGGTVIADGTSGLKDAYGALQSSEAHRDCFAATIHDIRGIRSGQGEALAWSRGEVLPTDFLRLDLRCQEGAEVLAEWSDGQPGATLAHLGAGRSLRLGGVFFAAYLRGSCDILAQLIGGWIPSAAYGLLRPLEVNPALVLRRLADAGGGELITLINHGNSCSYPLRAQKAVQIIDLDDGQEQSLAEGEQWLVTLDAGMVRRVVVRELSH